MIVSASRRTDLPAFYSEWFFNRLDDGYCLVPNPYNPKSIYEVSLEPKDVDAIVFWSKNPGPMIPKLDMLEKKGFRFYFHFTLTGYDQHLECHVPSMEKRLETFEALSAKLGKRRVIWRYDPIVISDKTDWLFHFETFGELARRLRNRTRRVVISFVEYYQKAERRLGRLEEQGWSFNREPQEDVDVFPFLSKMSSIAAVNGMRMVTCANDRDYSQVGIGNGSCIDVNLINRIWNLGLRHKKDPGQRKYCRCAPSRDIGIPDTCLHRCLYCYSTLNQEIAVKRNSLHSPESPVLWRKIK